MKNKDWLLIFFTVILCIDHSYSQTSVQSSKETYRPSFHFSPRAHWMNDPNGMIFYHGTYHLFFQHYPEATVWGPMHWGHATSTDLVHWKEQSIKLFPDSLGYIFSGSAVWDEFNTSGLGIPGQGPLVAIFTHHDPIKEKSGSPDFQYQSIAYSNDGGSSWTKYSENPVLKNPGKRDFRDPKVIWYQPTKKWIMTLAVGDHIEFYSSPDLKKWKQESEFGKTLGSHGGVWECPDLIPLEFEGKKIWVLLVSIGSGGPNNGSATQYFLGSFDGNTFTAQDTTTRFIDYGTDNYAGVTFSNTGTRKILMGWMSNWQYAQEVPTFPWRSAMTLPRELSLKKSGPKLYLTTSPIAELNKLYSSTIELKDLNVKGEMNLSQKLDTIARAYSIYFSGVDAKSFSLVWSNDQGDELTLGYDQRLNQYFIDRSKSGIIDFNKGFGKKHTLNRIAKGPIGLKVFIDAASIELFADSGLAVMTDLFFPHQPLNKIMVNSEEGIKIKKVVYNVID